MPNHISMHVTQAQVGDVLIRFYVTSKGACRVTEVRWGRGQWLSPYFVQGQYRYNNRVGTPSPPITPETQVMLDFLNSPSCLQSLQAELQALVKRYQKAAQK